MNPWQNPSIELLGIRIDEPVTTATDILVAIIGFIGFYKTSAPNNEKHITLYRYFFLVSSLSTFVSSLIGHAFAYRFGTHAKVPGWILAIAGISFAQFAVLYHNRTLLGENLILKLKWLSWIESIGAVILVFVMMNFLAVEIHSAFALLFMVTSIELVNYKRTASILSRNMIYGVLLLVIAVIFHLGKLSISVWFNHLDASHIFMALSMYIMSKGVYLEQQRLLKEA